MERVWIARSAAVSDDTIDGLWIDNGICNEDGTPRYFGSKSEIRRACKEKGVEPFVDHAPLPGSDKGANTTRWVSGPPPGYDPRPACMGGTPNRELEDWEKEPLRRSPSMELPMSEVEFAMRREVSMAELCGVDESVPNSEKYYVDNRDQR